MVACTIRCDAFLITQYALAYFSKALGLVLGNFVKCSSYFETWRMDAATHVTNFNQSDCILCGVTRFGEILPLWH